jgi:hypothetical protein
MADHATRCLDLTCQVLDDLPFELIRRWSDTADTSSSSWVLSGYNHFKIPSIKKLLRLFLFSKFRKILGFQFKGGSININY